MVSGTVCATETQTCEVLALSNYKRSKRRRSVRARLLLRQIRGADELCICHSVSPLEDGLHNPFSPQRTEAPRLNITIALTAFD